jgi:endonuclease/exonuclease/phosphatase family metal-dependent hydrolase
VLRSSHPTRWFSALLVLLAVLVSAAPAQAAEHPRPLRVATYNIHHGAGPDDVLDLEHVARILDSFDADVIGLQEVDRHWSSRSNNVDQPAWLAKRLNMHYAYAANLDLPPVNPGEPNRQYGTAVLSRYPITWSRNTLLPKFPDHEQRGLLETVLNVRGQSVRFANTHLQHNDNLEREEQAKKIVELLSTATEPTILVGDLNAIPGTPEITTLKNVLVDSWDKVGVGNGYTIPVVNPTARIDYVLATPDTRFRRAKVVSTDASDHLPLVVDLTVNSHR